MKTKIHKKKRLATSRLFLSPVGYGLKDTDLEGSRWVARSRKESTGTSPCADLAVLHSKHLGCVWGDNHAGSDHDRF